MPNWCEGTLKVRGNMENIRKFMEEGINWTPGQLVVEEEDDGELDFSISGTGGRWIKGTNRHFIMCDEHGHAYFYEGYTLFLHFKAAWNVSAEDLQKVCQTYGIDMKVQAFERGERFSQIVEIVGGEIVKDEVVKYDDWNWDCPCPTLGG